MGCCVSEHQGLLLSPSFTLLLCFFLQHFSCLLFHPCGLINKEQESQRCLKSPTIMCIESKNHHQGWKTNQKSSSPTSTAPAVASHVHEAALCPALLAFCILSSFPITSFDGLLIIMTGMGPSSQLCHVHGAAKH